MSRAGFSRSGLVCALIAVSTVPVSPVLSRPLLFEVIDFED
jgi:hypothetical protein